MLLFLRLCRRVNRDFFIYVGLFPSFFSLLFCLCFFFFIHFSFVVIYFFREYGTTHKVNNLIQTGGHFDSSTDVTSPRNKKRCSFNAEYKTCNNVFLQNALVLPLRKLILISFKTQSYLQNVTWFNVGVLEMAFSTEANYTKMARFNIDVHDRMVVFGLIRRLFRLHTCEMTAIYQL